MRQVTTVVLRAVYLAAEYPDAEALAEALRPMLYKTFKPAFLGRMKVISSRDGGGHVCLVYGVAAGKLVVIGSNQGNQICFELMNRGDKGEAFYVPVPYKDYADKDGCVLPDVDVDDLKKVFGNAVRISDEQIKAARPKGLGQA